MGGSCVVALRVRGARLGLSEPGAGDLPSPRGGRVRGYLGADPGDAETISRVRRLLCAAWTREAQREHL